MTGDIFALVYEELRNQARRQRAGWVSGRTMNTTALVHETYEKLVGSSAVDFENRAHFLAVAARAMRQILLDYAKAQRAQKRGGGAERVTLSDSRIGHVAAAIPVDSLIAMDDALTLLKSFNPDGARVLECRFLAGMTVEETAVALGISEPTVKRRWRAARAWLHWQLSDVGDRLVPVG